MNEQLRRDENLWTNDNYNDEGYAVGYVAEVLALGEWTRLGVYGTRSAAMAAIVAARRA